MDYTSVIYNSEIFNHKLCAIVILVDELSLHFEVTRSLTFVHHVVTDNSYDSVKDVNIVLQVR